MLNLSTSRGASRRTASDPRRHTDAVRFRYVNGGQGLLTPGAELPIHAILHHLAAPAVDKNALAGDERRVVAREERSEPRDVGRRSESADGVDLLGVLVLLAQFVARAFDFDPAGV